MNKDFNKENIDRLNHEQDFGLDHPYTCNGKGITECKRTKATDDRCNGIKVPYNNENEGILTATPNGWICPCGKYTQNWFH